MRAKFTLRLQQLAQLQRIACRRISSCDDKNILKPPQNIRVDTVVNSTLTEVLWSNLGKFESLPAFQCSLTGRKYTHHEIYKLSQSFGTALLNSGLSRNDVVGVILPNCPEYSIVTGGIWSAGLIATPANPVYTEDEIGHQLNTSSAKAVVATPNLVPALQNIQRSKGSRLKSIIVLSNEAIPLGAHSFFDMLKTNVDKNKLITSSGGFDAREQIAAIPFSSGTTGLPKGVVLTHSNLATNVLQFNAHGYGDSVRPFDGKREHQERIVAVLPFFHSFGLTCVLNNTVYTGSHAVTLSAFHKKDFIKICREHQPTFIQMVSPILTVLVNLPEFSKTELQSLDRILLGAAPVGEALISKFLEKAEKSILIQEGYGLTESSPIALITPHSANNKKLGSIGEPLPATIAKIIDPKTGALKGPNEIGELCFKGPQIMKGYLNNEEATKDMIDKDGWLHTGDVGYFDEDRYVFLVDRIKELIKVKGFQVAPSELEDLLRRIPKVADCAVIGVQIAVGEAPRAYVVKKDESLTKEEIHAFVKEKAAPYKQLAGGIEFVKEVPKTASGKLLRRKLKEMYEKTQKMSS